MKYFAKELVQNKLIGKDGKAIPFERIAGNTGVIKLDDADPRVEVLSKYVADGIGGVVVIDEATYEDLKKNHPYVPPAPKPMQEIRLMGLPKSKERPEPKEAPVPQAPPPDALQEHVRAATEKAIAASAAAKGHATNAAAADGSTKPKAAEYFPKTGKPKPDEK